MIHRRVQEVVKMPTAGQWQGQVPEIVDRREKTAAPKAQHVFHHVEVSLAPERTFDPFEFKAIEQALLAREERMDLRFKRWLSVAKLVAICLMGLLFTMAGLHQILR